MKNSAIYSITLASVLVLSLVYVEARGLGARGGESRGRSGGHVATSAPTVSRPSRVQTQSVQRSQKVNRPSRVQTQSVQRSQKVNHPSQCAMHRVHVEHRFSAHRR